MVRGITGLTSLIHHESIRKIFAADQNELETNQGSVPSVAKNQVQSEKIIGSLQRENFFLDDNSTLLET